MKRNLLHILLYITACIGLLCLPFFATEVGAKDFTVVIDAGHGGHDPGAIGKISKEKNINLNVALKLGRLIEQGCPDVKVVYTRKTDVFIPLNRRAEIANDAKADLFISIHTTACGSRNADSLQELSATAYPGRPCRTVPQRPPAACQLVQGQSGNPQ